MAISCFSIRMFLSCHQLSENSKDLCAKILTLCKPCSAVSEVLNWALFWKLNWGFRVDHWVPLVTAVPSLWAHLALAISYKAQRSFQSCRWQLEASTKSQETRSSQLLSLGTFSDSSEWLLAGVKQFSVTCVSPFGAFRFEWPYTFTHKPDTNGWVRYFMHDKGDEHEYVLIIYTIVDT